MTKYYKEFCLLFILMIIGGAVSLFLGQATEEYDVYNYHLYSPWAFLTNRIGTDVLPSGIRSYFNPILDIPFYIMFKYLNDYPSLIVFLQGTYWGGVIFFSYKISSLLTKEVKYKVIFNFFSCLLVAGAGVIVFEIGSFYNDMQIALLFLAGIYLYLRYLFELDSLKRDCYIFSGVALLGIVLGLKLTSAIMIFGVVFASLCLVKKIDRPVKVSILCLVAFIVGFIVVNGYWYYLIWDKFGNPFFPYFNDIFKSPYGNDSFVLNESYTRVLPKTFIDKVLYPFYPQNLGFGSWLFWYVDWRYAITVVCVLLGGIYYIIRLWKKEQLSGTDCMVIFLLIMLISSYILWLNMSPIVRYIIPLIAICCFVINYTCYKVGEAFKSSKIYLGAVICITIVLLVTTRVDYRVIRKPIEQNLLDIKSYSIENDSVVVLASQAVSISLLNLNPNARFVHLVFPESFNLECQAYPSRNIDYYYSVYYENVLKKLLSSGHPLYLIFTKSFYMCESRFYFQALREYMGKEHIYLNDCKEMGSGGTVLCKINAE